MQGALERCTCSLNPLKQSAQHLLSICLNNYDYYDNYDDTDGYDDYNDGYCGGDDDDDDEEDEHSLIISTVTITETFPRVLNTCIL